jgi:hypothetical protein
VLMFVITMLVIVMLSGLVLLAVAQGEGKLEELMEDDRPAATLLNDKWRNRLRSVLARGSGTAPHRRASDAFDEPEPSDRDSSDTSHYATH